MKLNNSCSLKTRFRSLMLAFFSLEPAISGSSRGGRGGRGDIARCASAAPARCVAMVHVTCSISSTRARLVNFLTALGDLGFRCLTGAEFLRHYSRTATEPPIDVIAFLKPLVTARSAQLTARATDKMVADATSGKVGISSSDRRRQGRSGGAVAATLIFTAWCGGSSWSTRQRASDAPTHDPILQNMRRHRFMKRRSCRG